MAMDPLDPYDIEQQQSDEVERTKIKKQQIEEDFKSLMRLPSFRRYMHRQLEMNGVYRTTFRPNSEMAFLEGVRAVGVRMLGECHTLALEETFLMMREALNE